MSETPQYDVVIVGAGPAGAAAAVALRAHELTVCVLDEQPRFGGQIFRQPPVGFRVDAWLPGKTYASGKALIAEAEHLAGLRHVPSTTTVGIFKCMSDPAQPCEYSVLFHDGASLGRVTARFVLLATGCYEMPVPFPGWQLPGVMSAGGIQTLLKSQRVAAAASVVLGGSHPLLLTVAEQLVGAGAKVAAVAFVQPVLKTALRLLAAPGAAAAATGLLLQALQSLVNLRRLGVPVLFGHTIVEATGDDGLRSVRLRSATHPDDRIISCDGLGLCYGFLASTELARQVGARHSWLSGHGWVVEADDCQRTSVPGISVAGEQTGIAGAKAAALSGEIAAIGIAMDAGRIPPAHAKVHLRRPRAALAKVRKFATLMAQLAAPPEELLLSIATPDTVVCRCEDVTVRSLRQALEGHPDIDSASTAKLLTRVGMGLCQGRMCEVSVRRQIAQLRGRSYTEVAGFVARAPVKPIPIEVLAADPGALDIDPTAAGH